MLIGIDANEANLTTNRVGINQYAFQLLHGLSQLDSLHTFVIYLKSPPGSDLPPSGPKWNYRVIPFPRAWTQTRLPFDLFFHHPRPDIFLSLTHYAPRWSHSPSVVAVMDLGFLKFPDQFTNVVLSQLKDWTAYSVRQATHVLAISEATKKDIVAAYGKDPSDITVTYLAYDKSRFFPLAHPDAIRKYGLTGKYFLFLSSLKPSKNVEGLIQAFSQFCKLHPESNIKLVIAGKKAWMYDRIFSQVKDLNLDSKVVFTGFVEDSDVPALMQGSVAYVLPSFYEGFGIPVLEAMACGTPVIVSRVASLPEVAGPAGIYIDPNDTKSLVKGLETAISPSRSKFVKLGLSRVKLFSWEKCARQTLSVLETCCTTKTSK
jgi:glycosyltransferase involved in cell wall biosynthesis